MRRFRRFSLLAIALAFVLSGFAPFFSTSPASADVAELPPTPQAVYFPHTGHNLIGGFLSYWRRSGSAKILGLPVTEEVKENGLTVQYFENGRLLWDKNAPAPDNVRLGYLGQALAAGRTDPYFKPLPSAQEGDEILFVPQTGHTISFDFLNFWKENGGEAVFGKPISEEFQENGRTVQYFEQARFEYHPEHKDTGPVKLTNLGLWFAKIRGFDTSPKPPLAGAVEYSNKLWPKVIDVNLSIPQTLIAYEGGQPVFKTLVSGGLYYPTPEGTYAIDRRILSEHMKGGTPGIDFYDLYNVPYTMYFLGGYALHGTYWHNNFGYPMSHGCVNLPTPAAEWIWNWAPMGTLVTIHY